MSDFGKIKQNLRSDEKFYSSLTNKVISIWNENNKTLSQLVLEMWCFIISWKKKEKKKKRNNSLKYYGLCSSFQVIT